MLLPKAEELPTLPTALSESGLSRGRGRPKILNKQQEREILDLLGQGETAKSIAQRYGVKPSVVDDTRRRLVATSSSKARTSSRVCAGIHYANKEKINYLRKQREEIVSGDNVVECGISLIDLESHHCRWPIGVDVDGHQRFCGAQKLASKSYCQEHHKQSIEAQELAPIPAWTREFESAENELLGNWDQITELYPAEEKMRIGDETFD